MDQGRLRTLEAKARSTGLSDEEAGELGRLYAEVAGKAYSDAEHERDERQAHERPLRERRERQVHGARGPFGRRKGWPGRSLELGGTATHEEDVERHA